MKLKQFLITFIISLFAFNISAKAQFGYKETYKTISGVEITYKWSHSKWWDKSSPLQLRFKMKNTNEDNVNIKFELVYMIDHIVNFKSGTLESEIKAGKSISGKLNGFYFETAEISNKTLNSESFEWDFISFEVNTNIKEE